MLGPLRQETEQIAEVRPRFHFAKRAAREQRREDSVDFATFIASDESMFLISACGYGLRTRAM